MKIEIYGKESRRNFRKINASKLKNTGENEKQIKYKKRKLHELEDRPIGTLKHRTSIIGEDEI
ncbi:hypothetical protein I79_016302 [Cricetulus griseus]|uniref:Uncharacterized protein n=1 Tax=Cricetulus griseus TaxID=10029 RepID=G3HZ07_CRIGR|nr:hypothetical protein I79_016302 [Cricetulus griseus]